MTNEQAIDLLDNLIGMVTDSNGKDYDTALKMAIKVLKEIEDTDIYYTSDYLSDNKEPDPEAILEYIKKHNLMDAVKEELKDFVEQYSFVIKKEGNK